MSGPALVWLTAATAAFLGGSALLRLYVEADRRVLLLVAYTSGNLLMMRPMREGGMAVAISVPAVLQLVLANAVAFGLFGERPSAVQATGIALGVVATALILWPAAD